MIRCMFLRGPSVILVVGLLVCPLVGGCGGPPGLEPEGPTGTVSGKVTWKGAPLTEGTITFVNPQQGLPYSASIGPDGSYALVGPFNGAIPVGEYQVAVAPVQQAPSDPMALMQPMGEPGTVQPAQDVPGEIPLKYRSADMSGIKKTVVEGANDVPIDIPE